MRSEDDKKLIVSKFQDPFTVEKFLTDDEINLLVDLYNSKQNKIHKNTGPITSSIMGEKILDDIVLRLQPIIGNFTIYSAAFFDVKTPHIIHNDDSKDLPLIYKGITLPLKLNYRTSNNNKLPYLCFFNQYYLDGPAKFFNGETYIPTYYNKQIYDYADVVNKSTEPISDSFRREHLSHLKAKWLEGLSILSLHTWRPGNAIIFDCPRLHCASDFRNLGIESKLGISIFTHQ